MTRNNIHHLSRFSAFSGLAATSGVQFLVNCFRSIRHRRSRFPCEHYGVITCAILVLILTAPTILWAENERPESRALLTRNEKGIPAAKAHGVITTECSNKHTMTLDLPNGILRKRLLALACAGFAATCPFINAEEAQLPISSVVASSNDGNLPANTIDGSTSTRWSAQGTGQWIKYDLGFSKAFGSIDIAWYKGDTRVQRFDVQGSLDGFVWANLFSGSSSGRSDEFETYGLKPFVGRYVRLVCYGNSASMWNSISETEIFGPDTSPTPPPTPSGGLPADLLNLLNWKVTLPVNTSHAGNPDEILQPELDSFSDKNYFFVDSTDKSVVFRANCGGATTSGSGYPRSELREMTKNGSANASWSTTSGTHTLEITQAITHLPVVKPHVVAGQIHNSDDDVIVVRLEGSKLFIDLNGKTGPVLTSTYKPGDIFTFKFVARNGGIECFYNGKYIYRHAISTSGCYFKVGCYTQSNLSKGDAANAYGEVKVLAATVTHQ